MDESPEQLKEGNLQEEIDKVWQNKLNWNDGQEVRMDGLPEGIRLIELDPHTLVLRSLIPNAPRNENKEEPDDVPVGLFSVFADPEEIKKEAYKIGTAIIKGKVRIDNAKIPEQIKNPK